MERNRLIKNIYCVLRTSAYQMLLKNGKHRHCACGHPPEYILSPVHLNLSGDLSLSADDADPLRVDPEPENVRLKHFQALNTLRTVSFKLLKTPLPGFLTILTL